MLQLQKSGIAQSAILARRKQYLPVPSCENRIPQMAPVAYG